MSTDDVPREGLKVCKNTLYYRQKNGKKYYRGRYSDLVYKNSPSKIESIKEKYKNGLTKELLDEALKDILDMY